MKRSATILALLILNTAYQPTWTRLGDGASMRPADGSEMSECPAPVCGAQDEYQCYISGTTSGWCWIRANCRFQGLACCSGFVEARCDWCEEDCYVSSDWDSGCEGYVECWCTGGGNLSFCCC